MDNRPEQLSAIAVECGYKLHVNLGPGLLESVYEALLAKSLADRDLKVDRQKPIRIRYQDVVLEEGFRVDLLVDGRLPIELKSTERHMPVHAKQLLTYLRLMDLPLGLLMNFGAPTFKAGCRRIVNNHTDFAASRLRVNQLRKGPTTWPIPPISSPLPRPWALPSPAWTRTACAARCWCDRRSAPPATAAAARASTAGR